MASMPTTNSAVPITRPPVGGFVALLAVRRRCGAGRPSHPVDRLAIGSRRTQAGDDEYHRANTGHDADIDGEVPRPDPHLGEDE